MLKKSSNVAALLISIFFPPEFGGGSNGAWDRAVILNKLGYSVFVVCGFPSYPTGKVSDPKYKRKRFFVETVEQITVIRLRLLPINHEGIVNRFVIFCNFIFFTILYMPKILKITG